ncbi:DUF4399 domain-containing protein [Gammaproteobacteria bacterium]|nr:DUF4399 domain-containing protein [Gammaproteobacteria bacterium]MDA9023791.1 DUF4399 domain-containing protein [Gammaproteobacteria bacterium]MDA9027338.1 DUF4399 domain-containing protein [Gammaproteobacteria bacterium]MDA9174775.1 DUF4399 domain-containing protein [Gammaproteobacteria bacterium]MDA9762392.1 DUF4399 domain-containing protein [Gammaproteobacteria bacterium]
MIRLLLSLSLFFANGLIALEFSKGAPAAAVYFITPKNDDIVSGEVVVKFGLQNFGVSPAGLNVNGTGHHHLIIDADLPNLTQPIQADKNHVHFGKGQTEVKLELEPGSHTLQLLLGDYRHVPHNPPIFSNKITIFVQ